MPVEAIQEGSAPMRALEFEGSTLVSKRHNLNHAFAEQELVEVPLPSDFQPGDGGINDDGEECGDSNEQS